MDYVIHSEGGSFSLVNYTAANAWRVAVGFYDTNILYCINPTFNSQTTIAPLLFQPVIPLFNRVIVCDLPQCYCMV
jgi:hypothetical protein